MSQGSDVSFRPCFVLPFELSGGQSISQILDIFWLIKLEFDYLNVVGFLMKLVVQSAQLLQKEAVVWVFFNGFTVKQQQRMYFIVPTDG